MGREIYEVRDYGRIPGLITYSGNDPVFAIGYCQLIHTEVCAGNPWRMRRCIADPQLAPATIRADRFGAAANEPCEDGVGLRETPGHEAVADIRTIVGNFSGAGIFGEAISDCFSRYPRRIEDAQDTSADDDETKND